MDIMQLISLIASISSVVLAIIAIFLSVVFYRWSTQIAESAKDMYRATESNLTKLEKLFDSLYSGTFTIMKDTVSDMRKHLFHMESNTTPPKNEIEERTNRKIASLKQDLTKSIDHLIVNQSKADQNFESIKSELNKIVNKAVEDTRKAENDAKSETLRKRILEEVRSFNDKGEVITVVHLYSLLGDTFSVADIAKDLWELKKEKIVDWQGTRVHASEPIKLVDRKT